MAFVKFIETGKSFAPKASINPRGYLSFNDGAMRRFKITDMNFVILYYDEDEKKIGIELIKDETTEQEGALKIRKRASTGASVGAKAFIDYFDIKINVTTMYGLTMDDNKLIIDLTKGVERKNSDNEKGDDEYDNEE